MFNVKEIFSSIQGEGFYTGRPAVFLRFTGCNLWNGKLKDKQNAICNFCDTNFVGTDGQNGGTFTLNQIIEKVEHIWNRKYKTFQKFVVLTGGEPMLQTNFSLVQSLKQKGFFVALETNGTIEIDINFDWVCVSPKNLNLWKVKKGDELKIIYPQSKFNLNYLKKLNFKYFFLQPLDDNKKKQVNIMKTIDYCRSHKPWFPSFQIHKTLNVN